MSDNRDDSSKYAWMVAMVAVFLLVFGGVWMASSPRASTGVAEPVAKPEVATYEAFDRSYTARVPMVATLPPSPVFGRAPVDPSTVVVTPVAPQTEKSKPAPQIRPKQKKFTPRDMFPMGDITRDLPKIGHPYRQIAELYPSFEYKGKLWLATGRYVLSSQADLVPTGLRLTTGQYLFALSDGGVFDGVLFVQSELNPGKFAIYRAT